MWGTFMKIFLEIQEGGKKEEITLLKETVSL